MASDEDRNGFTYKDLGLEAILKAIKGPVPVARVGILGNKNSRSGKANSNATIGAKHEFGEDGMPIRSFLRIPIIENFQKALDRAGALEKGTLKQIVDERSLLVFIKKLGILAEGIVAEGFATGGFGKWKPSNMRYKQNKQTLVETTQLRNSITSEVK